MLWCRDSATNFSENNKNKPDERNILEPAALIIKISPRPRRREKCALSIPPEYREFHDACKRARIYIYIYIAHVSQSAPCGEYIGFYMGYRALAGEIVIIMPRLANNKSARASKSIAWWPSPHLLLLLILLLLFFFIFGCSGPMTVKIFRDCIRRGAIILPAI